jgi:drug/metabolite transporter (DMT)-like permease
VTRAAGVAIGAAVAVMVVAAQSLWAKQVRSLEIDRVGDLWSSHTIFTLFSARMLGGAVLYAVGGVLYIYLLSRFGFVLVQATVIAGALLLAPLAAALFLDQPVSALQLAGLVFLLAGLGLIIGGS